MCQKFYLTHRDLLADCYSTWNEVDGACQTCRFCYNDHSYVVRRSNMAKGKKGKKKAETVFLVCEETGEYNYAVRKKPGGEKLKLSKYCPKLRKHTIHNEKKK